MKQNLDLVVQKWFVIVLVVFSSVLALLTISGLFALDATSQAAVVNGEVITEAELLETYNQLPSQYQEQFSEQDVLEQLIDKTLILQEANKRGIRVSDQEVDAFIDEQVASFGISRQQLESTLKQGGLSIEEYEQAVYEELVLRRFVDEVILSQIPASNESVQAEIGSAAIESLVASLREDAAITYASEYQEN
jgi:peptidyl-prolyl cis-trans isomerase SurA